MSWTTRPGAAAAAVLAAMLLGAPTAQAVSWSAVSSHGGESAPVEAPTGSDHHAGHDDHGGSSVGDHGDDHADHGTSGPDDHADHGTSGPDDHADHGTSGPDDHGEEGGGDHGADPDAVTPETRRLVLSGFGGLNAAVLTAAFLFRLRDRRTGAPSHIGREVRR